MARRRRCLGSKKLIQRKLPMGSPAYPSAGASRARVSARNVCGVSIDTVGLLSHTVSVIVVVRSPCGDPASVARPVSDGAELYPLTCFSSVISHGRCIDVGHRPGRAGSCIRPEIRRSSSAAPPRSGACRSCCAAPPGSTAACSSSPSAASTSSRSRVRSTRAAAGRRRPSWPSPAARAIRRGSIALLFGAPVAGRAARSRIGVGRQPARRRARRHAVPRGADRAAGDGPGAARARRARRRGAHRRRRRCPRRSASIASAPPGIDADVRDHRLREDLYRRLSASLIDLPPLRERAEDVPAIVARIMEERSAADGPAPARRSRRPRWRCSPR